MTTDTTNSGAAANYCTACRGEGIIHAGIEEASTTLCKRCEGGGIEPAAATQATSGEAQGLAKQFGYPPIAPAPAAQTTSGDVCRCIATFPNRGICVACGKSSMPPAPDAQAASYWACIKWAEVEYRNEESFTRRELGIACAAWKAALATTSAPASPPATSVAGGEDNQFAHESLPSRGSLAARPLLYSETVNDMQVFRDDLWIVTTQFVDRAFAAAAQAPAAKAEPVHFYRHWAGDKWHECTEQERADRENGPVAHTFKFRTLYTAPVAQADDVRDAERWRFMMRVAYNREGPEHAAMTGAAHDYDDERPESVQLCEAVDKAMATLRTPSAAPADKDTDCKCQQGQCCIVCDPDAPWIPADKEGE